MSHSQDTLSSPFYISTIHISLAKDAESIKLKRNDKLLREFQRTISASETHKQDFSPHLALNPDDQVFVSVHWSSRLSKRPDIDINLRDMECVRDEQGLKSYRKKAKNVEVVVTGYHALSATTPPIIQSCSQIRILVIGNSGVGKSSLIHRVFGVESVQTSQTTHGFADIDREFVSPTNERFVVHDSLGFEACDEQNVDTVKQFIARRTAMPRPQDQLHAIWLCLEIPYAGARLFEAGVEKFLQRRDGIMGKVPLVVVLTKVDLMDTQLELDLPANETLEHYKSMFMNDKLIRPLREVAGSDLTYVTVSVDEYHSESLSNLIKVTNEHLAKYLVDEAPRAVASNMGCPQSSHCAQLDNLPKRGVSGFVQFQAV